jgi:Apea-like HEPN
MSRLNTWIPCQLEFKNFGPDFLGTPLACGAAAKAWEELPGVYQNRVFENKSTKISFRMSKNSSFFQEAKKAFLGLIALNPAESQEWPIFPTVLDFEAEVQSEEAISDELIDRTINNYSNLMVSELFIALNLCAPGSFHAHLCSTIIRGNKSELFVDLMGDYFGDLWSHSKDYLPISQISTKDTLDWLFKTNFYKKTIAENAIDNALFSLLHFSKKDRFDQTRILWLSHALESLYKSEPDTKIVNTLKKRITQFLSKKSKTLPKNIGLFYDYRSKFVHGSLKIMHPLADSIYDDRIDESESELYENINTGILLVVATLQRMIVEDLSDLIFEEKFRGIPFSE